MPGFDFQKLQRLCAMCLVDGCRWHPKASGTAIRAVCVAICQQAQISRRSAAGWHGAPLAGSALYSYDVNRNIENTPRPRIGALHGTRAAYGHGDVCVYQRC